MNEHKRSEGSRCKGSRNTAGCQQTEAACARLGSCCPACSHWRGWTADGERIHPEVGGRPVAPVIDAVTAKRREQWRARYRQRQAS